MRPEKTKTELPSAAGVFRRFPGETAGSARKIPETAIFPPG